MNKSDNSRNISRVCELRVFLVFVCAISESPQMGALESQSELTLIQASASRFHTATTNCCESEDLMIL